MVRRRRFLLFWLSASVFFLCACRAPAPEVPREAGDLAGTGQVLCLPEAGTPVPYDVLGTDAQGNVLLLRRELLGPQLPFREDGGNFYDGSCPDTFLNGAFLETFPPEVRDQIVPADIRICRPFPHSEETEVLRRRIFLLSAAELGLAHSSAAPEGTALDFFAGGAHWSPGRGDVPQSWWLRSSYLMDRDLAWQIHADGTAGGSAVREKAGLRPALYLRSDAPVVPLPSSTLPEGFTLSLS